MTVHFPCVSFHEATQRLAVGTRNAQVIVYDLRTATRWRVLAGHTSGVAVVSFSSDGDKLATYAPVEAAVREWQVGVGFFGSLLRLTGQCVRTVPLPRSDKAASTLDALQRCVMRWEGPNIVRLVREDGSVCVVRLG